MSLLPPPSASIGLRAVNRNRTKGFSVTPASLVQRLAAVPPPEEAPDFYRDLSAEDPFKVAAKRGECAA